MRFIFAAVLFATVSFGQSALSQQSRVVVELFTSQGCSSCPDADALLTRLSKRKDVIALGLHVDYWDYLGWKDPFGMKVANRKQNFYAAHTGRVYTPMVVINGSQILNGNDQAGILNSINSTLGTTMGINLEFALKRDPKTPETLIARLKGQALSGEHYLNFAVVEHSLSTVIQKGENHGKTLRHANVARALTILKLKDGPVEGETTIQLPAGLNQKNASLIYYLQSIAKKQIIHAGEIELASL